MKAKKTKTEKILEHFTKRPGANVKEVAAKYDAPMPMGNSTKACMMPLVVASVSLPAAVIPTVVPLAAFSLTALAAAFKSLTAPTSNSPAAPARALSDRHPLPA